MLGRIGVNVAVVPAQEKPDGDFKTCEYPNPETDAALNESYKIARETHPDLILGHGPGLRPRGRGRPGGRRLPQA